MPSRARITAPVQMSWPSLWFALPKKSNAKPTENYRTSPNELTQSLVCPTEEEQCQAERELPHQSK
ncbi:hypothetical protein DPMN_079319 [Dreissena polymorpha]|uniref:Uncharacterized protein n=1 Tax=Dreissena polymorpha TaxID=45954 RepID=A0A9D3YU92_DREPO|nr:hypothetical protein DPMN_079319 [Dreissena polymorpha]